MVRELERDDRIASFRITSPDRPESEWTWRILVRDLPDTESLSIAADLVPDLDGTSSQELTHDFTAPVDAGGGWLPWTIGGAAVVLVLGGALALRTQRSA